MKRFFKALCSVAVLILIWQAACTFTSTSRVLFPPPGEVAVALFQLAREGELFAGIAASLARFGAGYLLAALWEPDLA